jgi:2-enoate reductase
MAAAGAMEFKRDVAAQVAYLERQLYASGAKVELGREATIDEVRAFDPAYVVVATGADPIVIPVPGAQGPQVKLAIPVLLGEEGCGKRVAVIGGGDVGCELAVELCRQGKDVTIVEMLDRLMARGGSFVANEQNLRHLVERSGAQVMCGARLTEIREDGVVVLREGEEQVVPCDTVVFAAGYRADHSLYEAVFDAGYECVQVGDNVRPGKIIDAIGQGYNYMRVLE